MTSASPQTTHPTQALDTLLRAHAQSSALMAVYLIGGGALVATSVLMLAYASQFPAAWSWLPTASMLLTLSWVAAGAALVHRHHLYMQTCNAAYEQDLQRIARDRYKRALQQPKTYTGWAVIAELIQQTSAAVQRGEHPPALPITQQEQPILR